MPKDTGVMDKILLRHIEDELHKHHVPGFRDETGEDTGGLHCKCGVSFPKRPDGIRDWDAYYRHWAEEIAKAVRQKPFNMFHPEWQEWVAEIASDLRYDGVDELAVAYVLGRISDLGFVLYPPRRNRNEGSV